MFSLPTVDNADTDSLLCTMNLQKSNVGFAAGLSTGYGAWRWILPLRRRMYINQRPFLINCPTQLFCIPHFSAHKHSLFGE